MPRLEEDNMSLTQKEALQLYQEDRTSDSQSNRYKKLVVMSHDEDEPISFVEYYKDSTKLNE